MYMLYNMIQFHCIIAVIDVKMYFDEATSAISRHL